MPGTAKSHFTLRHVERLAATRLRCDGGLWSQGVHIGEKLIVEDAQGFAVFAVVERGRDERPELVLSAGIGELANLRIRRPQARR